MAELVNAGGWRGYLKPLKQTAVPCGFESHSSVFHYNKAHWTTIVAGVVSLAPTGPLRRLQQTTPVCFIIRIHMSALQICGEFKWVLTATAVVKIATCEVRVLHRNLIMALIYCLME